MFGDQMVRKDRIEKIAMSAVMASRESDCSLTDVVIKSAMDHGLNPYEWEHVCHRVNHMIFKDKYANDKLAVFNIANHKDVAIGIGHCEKVASGLVAAQPDTIITKGHPKIESEPVPQEITDGRNAAQGSNIAEAGERNADILNSLNFNRDKVYDQMYNTIRALVQSKESLKDIHEVLLKSWGHHNKDNVDSVFGDIIERLKSEGYVGQNTEYDGLGDGKLSDRTPVDNDLTVKAAQLIKINEDAIKHGMAHIKFMYMLRDKGFDKRADALSYRVKSNVMDDIIDDYTGWSRTVKIASIGQHADKATKAVKDLAGANFTKLVGDSFLKALPFLAVPAITYGAGEMYLYAKNKEVKKKLKQKYPELAEIDNDLYSDIFDTIVALNPTLLKTPFALASLIKKHAKFGAIETSTISALSSGGKKRTNLGNELTGALLGSLTSPKPAVQTWVPDPKNSSKMVLQSEKREVR